MPSDLEQSLVRMCIDKLSEMYNSPVRLLGTHPVGGGCINHALKMDTSVGEFFLKWNASAPTDIFLKEAEGLKEMKQKDNPYLQIPKVILSKEVDSMPGFLLMEFLPTARSTSGYDQQLGRGLAILHRKTSDAFGFHHPNYCGTTVQDNTWTNNWPEFYAHRRIGALVKQIVAKRGMGNEEQKTYEKLMDKIPQLLDYPTVSSLIHGDLWSGNYMHTAYGPALIDPACYYADREMELGMMQLFGGFSQGVWMAYQEEFPLPKGWQQRIPLYQLYHVLNHYLLFGGSYGMQAMRIARQYL